MDSFSDPSLLGHFLVSLLYKCIHYSTQMKSSFPKGVRSIFHENEVMNVGALGTNKSNKKVQ